MCVCVCVQYLYADARTLIWCSDDRASWYILIVKPTRCTNFSNLFWNKTLHVSDCSSVHHQEFHAVHTAVVYVIQVLLTACEQDHPDPAGSSWSCVQAVSKTCMTYTIAVCTAWNSWCWTEELSKTCRVLCFADRASHYSVCKWPTWRTVLFLIFVCSSSLHVSSNQVLIIRRVNCINTTSGICHSENSWMVQNYKKFYLKMSGVTYRWWLMGIFMSCTWRKYAH